jgi:AcrR family transcriptional regulator
LNPNTASRPHGQPRRRGRPCYDSGHTREVLLQTAEKLFATFGVEGVSMRAIAAAAGVTSPVAHYHFSSKDRLVEEVVRRRGDALTARTFELLQALEAAGTVVTPRAVAKVIATPYLELFRRDPVGGLRWTQIIGRLELSQDPRLLKVSTGPGSIDERFLRFVHSAFPHVSQPVLDRAWRITFKILLVMLGNSDPAVGHRANVNRATISEEYIDALVDFVASGFGVMIAGKRKRLPASPARRRSVRSGHQVSDAVRHVDEQKW